MRKTLKFKLYRNKKNKHLHQRIDIAGVIYNHCIALHRRYYRLTGKKLNQFQLMKHIAKLKKLPKYAYWNLVGSQAIQDIVQRVEKGYQLFFRNHKHGVKSAPPGFKKVKKYKSFTLKQAGWKLIESNRIKIGQHIYKFSKSRNIIGTIKTVTIKRNAKGELFLCFSVELDDPEVKITTGKIAGFDFGLKVFLTRSDGKEIESPQFFKQSINELRRASKNLSSKVKGSSNHRSAKYALQGVHEAVANRRRDWFFKLAHELTDEFDYLFFEDLNIKGMQRLWGRKVTDLAFAEFISVLEYVASTKGKVVHFVHRFYPSSKTCSCCGHVNHNLELSERRWRCESCNTVVDRDVNAAINILSEGTASLCGDAIRPARQARVA